MISDLKYGSNDVCSWGGMVKTRFSVCPPLGVGVQVLNIREKARGLEFVRGEAEVSENSLKRGCWEKDRGVVHFFKKVFQGSRGAVEK